MTSLEKITAALTHEWQDVEQIKQAAGISSPTFYRNIKILHQRGIAEKSKVQAHKTTKSTCKHLYRLNPNQPALEMQTIRRAYITGYYCKAVKGKWEVGAVIQYKSERKQKALHQFDHYPAADAARNQLVNQHEAAKQPAPPKNRVILPTQKGSTGA